MRKVRNREIYLFVCLEHLLVALWGTRQIHPVLMGVCKASEKNAASTSS